MIYHLFIAVASILSFYILYFDVIRPLPVFYSVPYICRSIVDMHLISNPVCAIQPISSPYHNITEFQSLYDVNYWSIRRNHFLFIHRMEHMTLKILYSKPMSFIAQYADPYLTANCNKKWLIKQMSHQISVLEEKSFQKVTDIVDVKGIGNIATMILCHVNSGVPSIIQFRMKLQRLLLLSLHDSSTSSSLYNSKVDNTIFSHSH